MNYNSSVNVAKEPQKPTIFYYSQRCRFCAKFWNLLQQNHHMKKNIHSISIEELAYNRQPCPVNVIPAIVTPDRRAFVAQQAFDWLKEKNTKDNFNEVYTESSGGVEYKLLDNSDISNTSTHGQNKNSGSFYSTEQKHVPKHKQLINGQKFDMKALQQRENHQVTVRKGQDPTQQTQKVQGSAFNEQDYYQKLNEPTYQIQRPNQLPPQLQPQKVDKTSNQNMMSSQYERLMQSRNYGQQQVPTQHQMGQMGNTQNRPEFGPNYQRPMYNTPQFVQ